MPAVRLIEIEGKETREITWMGKVIKVIDVMHTARLIEIEWERDERDHEDGLG